MHRVPSSFPLCVDGRMLGAGGTGVSRYAASLAATLPMIGGRPMILRDDDDGPVGRWLTAASPRAVAVRVCGAPDGGGAETLYARHVFRAAQVHFGLYGRMLRMQPDVRPGLIHWTYPVPIRMAGWINVYTVHDVIPLERPELARTDPTRLAAVLTRIVQAGDRIVTVSEDARARIVTQLGCPAGQVVNCYQAVDAAPASVPQPLAGGVLPGGYFLYCGLDEPRKNLPRLIDAYRRSGVAQPLVLVGPDFSNTLRADGAGIVRLPYLPADRLADLVAHATALLFPSLDEGFGLPAVEAMAAGTPVLTSSTGALAEVAGGAALGVDPTDAGAIAAGIARLAGDAGLRARLSAVGRLRAERFSRARFAARLRAVYADGIARSAGR
ncbi:glycosyltransferase family 4 protein [Sphingomonas arantia]|uniref:Glycosyltransferase family 4 protein n=1 Tax=Sphingomonas arantia TaxID=1460676 RepID=A0ABW4U0X9_9SPHN